MKRLLTMLAGLCAGVLCFAQKLSDTEVQVIAYWDKGDVMVYDFTQSRTQTEDGVVVDEKKCTEKHIFEVIGATDDSYTVRFSFDDVISTPVLPGAVNEVSERIGENVWFDIKTSELGTAQELTNEEAVFEAFKTMIPVMTDRVLSKYTAQELKEEGVSRDQLVKAFTQGLCQEEFLEKLWAKNILPVLRYHGARFELDKEYTVSQVIVDVLGSNTLDVDWKFWAESKECTDEFVVIRSYVEADKEVLTPILTELMFRGDPSLTQADVNEILAGMDAKLEQYSSLVVHLASGIPIQDYTKRITTLEEDGSVTVYTDETELLYSEDDYRNQ